MMIKGREIAADVMFNCMAYCVSYEKVYIVRLFFSVWCIDFHEIKP